MGGSHPALDWRGKKPSDRPPARPLCQTQGGLERGGWASAFPAWQICDCESTFNRLVHDCPGAQGPRRGVGATSRHPRTAPPSQRRLTRHCRVWLTGNHIAYGSNRILRLAQYVEICTVTTVLPSISKKNKVFYSILEKTSRCFSRIQHILVKRIERETVLYFATLAVF